MQSNGRNENRILAGGVEEGRKDTALRMLKAGKYALDEIAEMSGLSLEDVKALDVNKMA